VSLVGKVQRVRLTPRRRPGDLGRIRVALCAVFAAHGFIFASWAVRVPAVKEQAGASPAALGLAGAGLGGLLAPHLSPEPHLLLIALAGLLVSAAVGRTLLTGARFLGQVALDGPGPDGTGPTGGHGPGWRRALRTGRTVGLFGLIALCAAYDEGAIGDWGALHLQQDLGASAGLAAAGYAAFALAEACGRLAGTALLEGFGRTPVLVAGGLTACAGMLLATLAPDVWLALAGFAATGLGLANLFPAAIARAGLLAGSSGVALTSMLGYTGFLLGPPAIGFLASAASLRAGLTTLAFLGLAAAAIAYATRDQPQVS
jgi:hypothetical protein